MKRELVIVLDFGGQYNQLVARRVRESNVYCEIYSYRTDIETIKSKNPKGIISDRRPQQFAIWKTRRRIPGSCLSSVSRYSDFATAHSL